MHLMNDSQEQPTDNYAAMSDAGFYFINDKYVSQAFLCALAPIFGIVLPPPPYPYANLVAPVQEYLSDLLKGHDVTPNELSEFLDRTQAERHQIIFNFARKDFGEWFYNHPVQPCTTRAETLWSLYWLVNDLHWYAGLQMWECHVSYASLIQRLTTIQCACARFGHPLTELAKVLPAIAANNTTYLKDCIDLLKGEAAATYQHFCQDEATPETSPGAGTLPKPETAGFDSSGESDTGCLAEILKKLEKLDSIAQDTAAIRMELSEALQEPALRVQAPKEPAGEDSERNDEYIFRKNGPSWEIVFRGKSLTPVKDIVGFSYIATLLERPGKLVSAFELRRSVGATMHSRTQELDKHNDNVTISNAPSNLRVDPDEEETLGNYKSRLGELKRDIGEAEEQYNETLKKELVEQREWIFGEIRRITGNKGKSRSVNPDEEKARKAVLQRLQSAYEILGKSKEYAELLKHLESSISTGTNLMYRPTDTISWLTR